MAKTKSAQQKAKRSVCNQCATQKRRTILGAISVACCLGVATFVAMSFGNLWDQSVPNKTKQEPIQAPSGGGTHRRTLREQNSLQGQYHATDSKAWHEYQQSDYWPALKDYRQALTLDENIVGKDGVCVARDLRHIAEILDRTREPANLPEAEQLYKRALGIYDAHAKDKDSMQYVALLQSYALHRASCQDVRLFESYLRRAIDAFDAASKKDYSLGEDVYNQYIGWSQQTRQMSQAAEYTNKLEDMRREKQKANEERMQKSRRMRDELKQRQGVFGTFEMPGTSETLLAGGGFAGVALIMLIAFLAYAKATSRKYIELNDKGLRIGHKPCLCDGAFITWQNLVRVKITRPQNQRTTSDSADCKITLKSKRGYVFEISWADIVSCIEPGEFINGLKTWATEAISDCVFPAQQHWDKVEGTTYTQLWFKHFSGEDGRQRARLLTAGDVLANGRYHIAGKLGSGGQGTAYLGTVADNTDVNVVIKEYILPLHRGESILQKAAEKLHQEAAILRRIEHSQVVKVIDEFIEDYRGYLVMEHVTGTELSELVQLQGCLPEHVVVDIGLQVCDILHYLHSLNPSILHRDLTPNNLIIQEDGRVKLIDFNVAHQLESEVTATVVGKQCYIPPEQFRGKPTFQSDIYALGCTMFYLLTAMEPEPLSVSRPRDHKPTVSEALDALIAKCTAIEATQRYMKANDVRDALAAVSRKLNREGSGKNDALNGMEPSAV